MCPDPQLISVYTDGELPSPWKEKLEAHLGECSECKGKLKNFLYMQELFKKETLQKRIYVEKAKTGVAEEFAFSEHELIEKAKEKIWRKLESGYRFRRIRQVNRYNMWKRKIAIPIPAAAAAAIIIALLTALWLRNDSSNNNSFTQQNTNTAGTGYYLAAEEEIPEAIPTSDLNSVLQYLGVDRSEIIILQLPESRNFSRSGDPVIMSADYTGR